jgi:aspartyl-tRNA(Asn)/glutamyl-tRNA(Gln) amidotransferase subunit C
MEISDLRATADLAHLNLAESELAAAFPAFEQMLAFFAAMQAADEDKDAFPVPISGLSRTARAVSPDHFRLDTANSPENRSPDASNDPDKGHNLSNNDGSFDNMLRDNALLDNAGERDGRFIVVPNVL